MDLLPPATKLGQGYIFTGVCDSVHGGGGGSGGGIPACIAGDIPACLAAGGVLSQHALQEGCLLPGGAWSRGAALGGGCLVRGVPAPRGSAPGGDPPGRPLLRVVSILLECILVHMDTYISNFHSNINLSG